MSDAHEQADYRDDLGPFCDGCGQEIDPDTCHCGDAIGDYRHDNHDPVPMGCLCLYDELDWARVAKGLRERLRAEREAAAREIARLNAWLLENTEMHEEQMAAILDGTFAVGDGTAQREIERLRADVDRLQGDIVSQTLKPHLLEVVKAAADRFDEKPEYRASAEARAELKAPRRAKTLCKCFGCETRFVVEEMEDEIQCPRCGSILGVETCGECLTDEQEKDWLFRAV